MSFVYNIDKNWLIYSRIFFFFGRLHFVFNFISNSGSCFNILYNFDLVEHDLANPVVIQSCFGSNFLGIFMDFNGNDFLYNLSYILKKIA